MKAINLATPLSSVSRLEEICLIALKNQSFQPIVLHHYLHKVAAQQGSVWEYTPNAIAKALFNLAKKGLTEKLTHKGIERRCPYAITQKGRNWLDLNTNYKRLLQQNAKQYIEDGTIDVTLPSKITDVNKLTSISSSEASRSVNFHQSSKERSQRAS